MWVLRTSEGRLQKVDPFILKVLRYMARFCEGALFKWKLATQVFLRSSRVYWFTFQKMLWWSKGRVELSLAVCRQSREAWTHTPLPFHFIRNLNYELPPQLLMCVNGWFLVMDDMKWALNHLSVMTVCCRFCAVRDQKQTHWARDEAEPYQTSFKWNFWVVMASTKPQMMTVFVL